MKESEIFKVKNEKRADFLRIDHMAEDIILELASAPIYKKYARVQARQAHSGELVETILESGAEETDNISLGKDWVVTNPSGEKYITSGEEFLRRYKPSEEEGVYDPIGYCRAILNPFNKPIEIMASWGKPEKGDEHCMLAIMCDENGDVRGEPYIIGGTEFNKTYKLKQ